MTSVEELRARRDRPRDVQAEDLEAGRGAVRRARRMNFVIGLVLIYAIAVIWGLPNLHPPTSAVVGETACVAPAKSRRARLDEVHRRRARRQPPESGAGDVVVKVGDTPVSDFDDMAAAVPQAARHRPGRRRARRHRRSPPTSTSRPATALVTNGRRGSKPSTVGAIGVVGAAARAHAVQPAHRGARHLRLHRRPDRRAGQVAGRDPDQGRRAGARHRRRRARPAIRRSASSAPASSAATPSTTACGWRSGSSWPS